MSSESLHEDAETLGPEVLDRHRAIRSIMEEFEAVDWYDQRAAATTDPELADVLRHNRDEEKEHAAMTLEWLRRNDPVLDQHLRTYLFSEGSIREIEQTDGSSPTSDRSGDDLGVGSLSGTENT